MAYVIELKEVVFWIKRILNIPSNKNMQAAKKMIFFSRTLRIISLTAYI